MELTSPLTLQVEGLHFGYGATPVLREVTLPAMRAGQVTALIGPNATGKSTLLRVVAGFHSPAGTVAVRGAPEGDDRIVYVPQELPPPSSLTAFEAVLLAGQRDGPLRPSKQAIARVGATLARVGIENLASAPLANMSGGQRQLVGLAQALARRPAVLLLDEPTSNLDLRNQLEILELVRDVAVSQPAVVVLTIHDLALAARFADQIAVLHAGRVHSCGPPESVITAPMLRTVYRIDATVQCGADGALTVSATRSR